MEDDETSKYIRRAQTIEEASQLIAKAGMASLDDIYSAISVELSRCSPLTNASPRTKIRRDEKDRTIHRIEFIVSGSDDYNPDPPCTIAYTRYWYVND